MKIVIAKYKEDLSWTKQLPPEIEVCEFAEILDRAPEWDGHTPVDVLERLKAL